MIIDFKDYEQFIAELYEAEDECYKELYDDLEAEFWINEEKNN